MDRIIEVKNLAYTYNDGTEALQDVNFAVKPNSRVAVLGPNGAGKSTLLFHLNALYLAQKGEVYIKSRKIGEKHKDWVRKLVGLVMQDPDDQVFSTTVYEDVAFGLVNFGWQDRDKIDKKVKQALKSVDILNLQDKNPHHLSYGQKKRAAIAGILAVKPEIVIFDEPLSYLDPAGQKTLRRILADLYGEGKTLLVVTHDLDFAVEWADKIIIMKKGEIFYSGDYEIFARPDMIEEADLRLPKIMELLQELEGVDLKRLENPPRDVREAAEYLNNLPG
ncbi:cobalt/nickel transport system ATP-binding protein [Halarsenatibacter silvermanii]|uniref:Cobalt/nickel transport system ATP-binding protein n=2 Tax=Halarsenatibacter silvermanii TaxID=321763 RepID=A0A1G9QL75_9FIRM|nr:cobalt/nickel transport system ATP-binding protein [Halarsenatibacter silvermanii]